MAQILLWLRHQVLPALKEPCRILWHAVYVALSGGKWGGRCFTKLVALAGCPGGWEMRTVGKVTPLMPVLWVKF